MSRNNAGLSAERIIIEALRIIDGQGLRRLTMRRLGDALQVEAMAIYHHFPRGKEQIFDAIVGYITDVSPDSSPEGVAEGSAENPETAAPPTEDDAPPWDDRLRTWAHDYRAALLRHSGALTLLINRRPDTEAAVRSLETHYAAFTEAGLTGSAVVEAAAALDSYVTGAVIHQVRGQGLAGPNPATVDGRHPHVAHLAGEGNPDPEQRFSAGLEALLTGLTSGVG